MADGVDVHPPVAAGLQLVPARSEDEHLLLGLVELGLLDRDVEVELLRTARFRPGRRLVVRLQLKAQQDGSPSSRLTILVGVSVAPPT